MNFNTNMEIEIIDKRTEEEKLDSEFKWFPTRVHEEDAGADVYSSKTISLAPGDVAVIGLRFGLKLPKGLAGFIFPRSSMSKKGLTCELPPIDAGYRGEVHAIVTNNTSISQLITKGERIGQLVIMPVVLANFTTNNCGEPDYTDRGSGAFGSTGKN